MLDIKIRTRTGEYAAVIDERFDMANALWFSLPFKTTINMLGDSFYFALPDWTMEVTGEKQTVFEKGDIAYWPGVNAMVVMFGPTPLSGEDAKPVWKYGLIKIGHIVDECSSMEDAGDRQNITIVSGY